jgi:hypothetical protein
MGGFKEEDVGFSKTEGCVITAVETIIGGGMVKPGVGIFFEFLGLD